MSHSLHRTAALSLLLCAVGAAQQVPCGVVAAVGGDTPFPTPDFDQKRSDFPGDGGMYCVPTSFANLMAYYALRGYPELFPNYESYAYWASYDAVSDNIAEIATLMGTTAGGGTDRQPGFDGALAWMDVHGGPPMSFSQISGDEVTPEALYRILRMGGTATFAYGRFTEDAPGVWYRHGGHSVTLNSVVRHCPGPTGSVFNWTVTYRDPASNEDPNDLEEQSLFATSTRLCRVVTLTFGSNAEPPNPNEVHTALEMYVDNSGTRRFIREIKALTPELGLHRPFVLGTVWRFDPSIVFGAESRTIDFDPGPTEDVQFSLQPGLAMALRSQANGGLTPVRLAAWDAVTDKLVAQVSLSGADAMMTVGRQGQVHVFNNNLLRTFKLVGGEAPSFREVGTPRAVVQTAGSVVAVGFDDRDDRVLLLRSDGAVVRIGTDRTGSANGAMDTLGGGGVSFAAEGRKRITRGSAAGDDYWIGPMAPSAIGGPDTVRRFSRSAVAAVLTQSEVVSPPLPPLGGPGSWTHATAITDWSVADGNRMVLLRGSQMQEMKKNILWGNATAGPWFGRTARGSAAVSRSRNGMDRSEPDMPHLLSPDVAADEEPDCAADLGRAGGLPGGDGRLDNNDFIAFINYFFSSDTLADMGAAAGFAGHDGRFDNNDFIAFITAFFEGC